MDYDLEKGFVLRYDEAVKYLDAIAIERTKNVMAGVESSECMEGILEDLYEMKKEAVKGDVEYYKFIECPMSASNINIIPMVEKE